MDSFWEEQHKRNNTYWLTGSSPKKVLQMHSIPVDIKDTTILDIGVGKGVFAEYIHKNNDLISVDISYKALEKIKDISEVHHVTKLSTIRPVDLAICHLVFQHCNNNTITDIINNVQLKEDGIFSFQFAYLRKNESPNRKVKDLIKKGTHHFRSLETIREIINTKTNKKIISVSEPMHWHGEENFSWLFVKVANAD